MAAWLLERATGVPKVLPSMKNWTVPVGVPEVAAPTVAVKVTVCPKTEEAPGDAETAVVVALLATVWVKGVLLLTLKLLSPLYAAVTVWLATARAASAMAPVPPARVTGVP